MKKHRKYILFLCDFLLWNLGYYLSLAIINGNFLLAGSAEIFLKGFVLLNVCFTSVLLLFRLYDNIWRYADIEDFFYTCLASISANAAFFAISFIFNVRLGGRFHVMLTLMTTFFMFAFRAFYRVSRMLDMRSNSTRPKRRLLIVGAGEAAVSILREISKSASNEYLPVCIVDDSVEKIGRRISGVSVEGSTYEIPEICERFQIDVILFSISAIDHENKKRILDICAKTNTEVKIIPNIYDLVTANISLSSQIRNVEVEDLLGREPIIFETEKYGGCLAGKNVLITGGGGSIGSELCRQIATVSPKSLMILDIYENNAYGIQQELKRNHPDLPLEVEIASIRDYAKLKKIFSENRIDVVFHAAAHKHVPLMETDPEEAVKNNVFGTRNLIQLAKEYRVQKFVQISTDKAVNPTSVMGTTKRICEMMIQSAGGDQCQTEFVAVRFGNVLGSNGSVIPLFKEQIAAGGPVTVTHPEIIRYFMTIPEAVSLVLTAGGLAHGGEIFVLDMGEPVKIRDLAENLIRLSGFKPGKDIQIEYTGLRPGEKLFEELLMDEEGIQSTDSKKIHIGKPIQFDVEQLQHELEELHRYAEDNDRVAVLRMLKQIVPTFHHEIVE
jgi:FlaA1/EpsC-like NDP-sugar epimerase